MEKKILLCCFFSICILLNGCSTRLTDTGTPLTRMVITQLGENSIVVADLDSTPDFRSYDVPFTHVIPSDTAPAVEIHPWGGVAFVKHGSELFRINLVSGDVVPPTVDTDFSFTKMKPTPNGLYIVGFNETSHLFASQGNITDVFSTRTLREHRTLVDIDVCDNNSIILVTSRIIAAPHTNYVTKLRIDGGGEFTETERELVLPERNTVSKVACAAGSRAGVVTTTNNVNLISFTLDSETGIELGDTQSAVVNGRMYDGSVVKGIAFNPDGTELYARIANNNLGMDWIEKFIFDPLTAHITTTDWIAETGVPYSTMRDFYYPITIDPAGDLIYLQDTEHSDINIIRASDGSHLDDDIENDLISSPEHIRVGRVTCFDPDGFGCDD